MKRVSLAQGINAQHATHAHQGITRQIKRQQLSVQVHLTHTCEQLISESVIFAAAGLPIMCGIIVSIHHVQKQSKVTHWVLHLTSSPRVAK